MLELTKTDAVIQPFLKVINHYIATEKRPCDYRLGCLLYRSEVHTLEAIKINNGTNITGLATYLGVSKSAVSQMIGKLIKKNMVFKTVLSKSDTEVALTLTPDGEEVCNRHDEIHRGLYRYVDEALAKVSERDIEVFQDIMNRLDVFLDERK